MTMKCEKCGEEMNEVEVDDVVQVSCQYCSEVNEYDRGWNEALEAAMKINVPVDTDRLKMTHDEFRHFVNGIDELSKMINTLKK